MLEALTGRPQGLIEGDPQGIAGQSAGEKNVPATTAQKGREGKAHACCRERPEKGASHEPGAGSAGGTTMPVPSTAIAASPTSVTTQGIPQDIASQTTFGSPSP